MSNYESQKQKEEKRAQFKENAKHKLKAMIQQLNEMRIDELFKDDDENKLFVCQNELTALYRKL